MYGWCKLLKETKNDMVIGYSWQEDNNCDGRLTFNKMTKIVSVDKLSSSADRAKTSYFICPLRSRIHKGMELGKLYMVATG